jgi:hypothetical protein
MPDRRELKVERIYEPDDAALDEVVRILLPELAEGEPKGEAAA